VINFFCLICNSVCLRHYFLILITFHGFYNSLANSKHLFCNLYFCHVSPSYAVWFAQLSTPPKRSRENAR